MKMGAGLFWGLILIAIGLSIIFKVFFGISVFRFVIAAVFILIGIKILIGKPIMHTKEKEKVVMFGDRKFEGKPIHNEEYNTLFGKTVFDFRQIESLDELHTKITFNTIFGSTDVYLPKNIPVRIKTDAVFSGAVMPDGNSVAFGTSKYNSNDTIEAQLLDIESHVVFGSVNFIRK